MSALNFVQVAMPPLASMVDNTLTSLTQITIYLPEDTKVFKSVIARVTAMGTATAVGNVTTRRLQARLGAAGYTTHTNSNLLTGSGEDIFVDHALDLTAHFNTNWTGTSMTFDAQALMDGTATGIAWTNICVTLNILYEYDETTSTTGVKTFRMPLTMPLTNLATSKPGTALHTIPNLSTKLPEGSKAFRNHFVTVQGNINRAAATDVTMTFQLDSTTSHTTGVFEGLSNTDFFLRYIWDAPTLDTSASMGWYAWASATEFNHMQAWLTVTYEYDLTASNDMMVSVVLPAELASPMGGTTSSDYQRTARNLWIEEPGTITTEDIAFFSFWDQAAAIAGLNMRVGTGSFQAVTDIAATVAGSNAAMIVNNAAFTLARGRNNLTFDVYRTDTADLGMNMSGFWIVNYTAGKPAGGYHKANKTLIMSLGAHYNGAAAAFRSLSAIAPAIPETEYLLNAVGINYKYLTNTTGTAAGVAITAELLAAEGGIGWEPIYTDVSHTDPEVGIHECYAQARSYFKRWPTDPDPDRVDIETARRWRAVLANFCASFDYLDMMLTYHSITFTISGTLSEYTGDGSGIEVDLFRKNGAHRDHIGTVTTTTGGAYTFTWYDDTETVFAVSRQDSTHAGRSDDGLAT